MTHANTNYWRNKLSLWLHDPVCKVFDIPHHEEIAKRIAALLFQSIPEKDNYQAADCIASSLTRAALPSYKDGGGIDFSSNTQITHPLVKSRLQISLPEVKIEDLCNEIEALLKKDLGLEKTFEELSSLSENEKPLNAYFNREKSPEDWAQALFSYLFFAFQRRLRNENVGKLGAIWDVLPADTRMPDHPLWHHLGLVSALGSSMDEDSKNQIDMVVFSITPVQPFIAKARKLRDYWSGSVLLSYLSFTGITTVMENLGPDHIVYPSLHNQTLVNSWLSKKYHLGKYLKEEDETLSKLISGTEGIAAFPNKFIFLCPHDKAREMAAEIEKSVQEKWIQVSGSVKEKIQKLTGAGEKFSSLWDTQIEDFWKFSWASAKLAELSDKENIEKLVSGGIVQKEYELLDSFQKNFPAKTARLYTSTHSLVQSVLAAEKNKPSKIKRPQNGIKCPLCGEREVLNDFGFSGKTSAKEYSDSVEKFWEKIAKSDSENKNIRKNEKLCAVCAVKRFLPIVSKNFANDQILQGVFKSRNGENFPSTTEMAADDFIKKLKQKVPESSEKYNDIINLLHKDEDEVSDDSREASQIIKKATDLGLNFTNKDKYYALLLMDGDKMGDLINGETLSATWRDVLHGNLAEKIKSGSVKAEALKKVLDEKRSLNPALHAMISDSLNNFARFGVQSAVKNAGGELIYAGGDDVCAVLPLKNALSCAEKISKAYTLSFAKYTENGAEPLEKLDFADSSVKKAGYHLGSGAEGISISGAVIIAHHKEPLREVIQDAHRVLDGTAKEKTGRNAVAVRLKKRSGGDRDFSCKWSDKNLFNEEKTVFESFGNVCKAAGKNELSTSLLYKLSEMNETFEPLLDLNDSNKELILKLLKYEISHSGVKKEESIDDYTEDLAGICFQKSKDGKRLEYNFQAAVIANFLGSGTDGGNE